MRTQSWRVTAALAVAGGLLALPAAAGAATITVETTDTDDLTNNGTCSLREAAIAANGNSNIHEAGCEAGDAGITDVIQLAAATYTLSGNGDDISETGDLDFSAGGPVSITGAPLNSGDRPTTIIDGNDADRIFPLGNDGGGHVSVELSKLELRDGKVTGSADGGAVLVDDPDASLLFDTVIASSNEAGDYGGAVHFPNGDADARFSIVQSEFSGNSAGDEGGALWLDLMDTGDNETRPRIVGSTLAGNSSGSMGGAMYLGTRALDGIFLRVQNTTISGNSAAAGGGALAFDLAESGNAFFTHATIANNTTAAAGQGGAVLTSPGINDEQFVYFGSSIVAGNTAAGAPSNCVGPGNVQGSDSIESANSCGLTGASNKPNTDPLLAPLATNSGGLRTTRTHGLYDTSPAVNMVAPVGGECAGLSSDQRNVTRPAGPGCDAGAFEGTVGPKPATPGTPAKKCKKTKKKKKKKRSAGAAKKKKKKKKCKKKKKKKK